MTLTRDIKPRAGRAPRTDFAEFVRGLPSTNRMLGLTHTASSYVLRDIISDGSIKAQLCPVIKEQVTYAFYGRAAFRGGTEFEPTNLSCLFPSVLILDPTEVPPPKYVFGFDSGAFVGGFMDQYLHPYMPLFDFLLSPEPGSAAKLVSALFSTDDDYLRNHPSSPIEFPPSNFEVDCYLKMIFGGGQGGVRLDDRSSTPELLFSDAIDLKKAVRAAIIPQSLAVDPKIGGALKEYGVNIYEYIWTNCSRPIEIHMQVRQMVESAYRNMKWL